MRIWHEDLIPKLCQKHLCAMWREGLGAYKIVTHQVDGGSYKNHPATKEFIGCPWSLWFRLNRVREEMLKRGYHPKPMPNTSEEMRQMNPHKQNTPWQTLEEQIEVLKLKNCKCKI